jgi:hypothetical protein
MELGNLGNASQAAIDAVKAILGAGSEGRYMPGVGIVKDVTTSTGLVAYNLEPAAKVLQPILTPLRNMLPRVKNTKGGTAVNWKQIASLDISTVSPFTAEGTKGAAASYTSTDKSASFKTISRSSSVTFEAQNAGVTFEDVKAKDTGRLLNTVMLIEEKAILGGRVAALGTVTAPTVVCDNTGAIADGTYSVICRAITNLSLTQSIARGKKSSNTSTGALSTSNLNRITASVPVVEGAVAYEWYIGTAAAEKYQTTTQINSVSVTALLTATALPADNSADTLAFDGIIAQLTDALSPANRSLATGTNGTGTQLANSDLDAALKSLWDNAQADPDVIVVNSEQSIKITANILAANGGPTLYVSQTGEGANQGALTGGYRATHYMNPVTGKPIPIKVHPYLAAGTLLILTLNMPISIPDSQIDNAIDIFVQAEYMQLDYAMSTPKWEYEVRVEETLRVFFTGGCAVIRNIAPNA